MTHITKKVVGNLVGVDSNIYSLGGCFRGLARAQGWKPAEIDAVLSEVMKCNSYDDALSVLLCHMQDEEQENGEGDVVAAGQPEVVPSPYAEALSYVSRYPFSDSAIGMAKLVMSLYDNSPFGYRECITSFGRANLDLALRVIQHFHSVGENEELCEVGRKIVELLPRLHKAGQKAHSAFRKYIEERNPQEIGE